jgi:hypothetical protein
MSLYKLASSKTLHTEQEIAEYLEDLNFIENVCENMEFETRGTVEAGRSAAEKIRNGDELSEREARTLAAIYYGDAEWQGPW